jgi:hypothetical protein
MWRSTVSAVHYKATFVPRTQKKRPGRLTSPAGYFRAALLLCRIDVLHLRRDEDRVSGFVVGLGRIDNQIIAAENLELEG